MHPQFIVRPCLARTREHCEDERCQREKFHLEKYLIVVKRKERWKVTRRTECVNDVDIRQSTCMLDGWGRAFEAQELLMWACL